MTYIMTALQLALSLNPGDVTHYWKLYSMGFIPTQLPLAFAEFALTGYVIRYISETRSDLIGHGRIVSFDRFTKTALSVMVMISLVIVAGAYIGHLRGTAMAGTDSTVEAFAAPGAGKDGIGVKLMARIGEPLGFAFVGITGGLLTGYFWTGRGRKS